VGETPVTTTCHPPVRLPLDAFRLLEGVRLALLPFAGPWLAAGAIAGVEVALGPPSASVAFRCGPPRLVSGQLHGQLGRP
jgi:hypothetical protein